MARDARGHAPVRGHHADRLDQAGSARRDAPALQGSCERVDRRRGPRCSRSAPRARPAGRRAHPCAVRWLIRPPAITPFYQVLAYLRAKPARASELLDRDKPLWPAAQATGTSRTSDEEMARINIEASAALAGWLDLHRSDRGGRRYAQFVDRAVSYLPMPRRRRSSRPAASWPWRIARQPPASCAPATPSESRGRVLTPSAIPAGCSPTRW